MMDIFEWRALHLEEAQNERMRDRGESFWDDIETQVREGIMRYRAISETYMEPQN